MGGGRADRRLVRRTASRVEPARSTPDPPFLPSDAYEIFQDNQDGALTLPPTPRYEDTEQVSDSIWLLRHGDTSWTRAQRHTGRQDVPLSRTGRAQVRRTGLTLVGRQFEHVFVSPQLRAMETCRLVGRADAAQVRDELAEWDYGEYEGLTDEETQQRAPGWNLFRDGCPGGESPEQVGARVDRVLEAVRPLEGPCLLVSHGKMLRALAARWLGSDMAMGSVLPMDPAAISVLEREGDRPLLRLWNLTPSLVRADSLTEAVAITDGRDGSRSVQLR
jgi:broad specificity phosphatase PhoE